MTKSQYTIYVGYTDAQLREQFIPRAEFVDTVSAYLQESKIDFSISHCIGGYTYQDGKFQTELTMIVHIDGESFERVQKVARALSMYMNQENVMVVREKVERADELFQKAACYVVDVILKNEPAEPTAVGHFQTALTEICAELRLDFSLFTQPTIRIAFVGVCEAQVDDFCEKLKGKVDLEALRVSCSEIAYVLL